MVLLYSWPFKRPDPRSRGTADGPGGAQGKEMRAPFPVMLMAVTLAALPGIAASDTTYKYRDQDGTVWLTDRPASGAQFHEFEFLGYHGRPPARLTCADLPEGELEHRADSITQPLHEYAARFGVEAELARAIVAVESCFDPEAVSRVGARGLMQLMPRTAESLGVSDSFDIHQNLRAGIEYFQRLHQRYDGDPILALAAYNAGPGAVDRHGGVPPFPETERYIERVVEHWNEYRRNSGNQ